MTTHCTICQRDRNDSAFSASMVNGANGQCRACMALYRLERAKGSPDPIGAVRASLPPVVCSVCGTEKPATEFSPYASVATCTEDWTEAQAERKRQHMRDQRAEKTPEEKAAGQAAWRAGIRKDKCAVCASAIEGQGLCLDCRDLVDALGGLDGIKRAVKAVRWLEAQA